MTLFQNILTAIGAIFLFITIWSMYETEKAKDAVKELSGFFWGNVWKILCKGLDKDGFRV